MPLTGTIDQASTKTRTNIGDLQDLRVQKASVEASSIWYLTIVFVWAPDYGPSSWSAISERCADNRRVGYSRRNTAVYEGQLLQHIKDTVPGGAESWEPLPASK